VWWRCWRDRPNHSCTLADVRPVIDRVGGGPARRVAPIKKLLLPRTAPHQPIDRVRTCRKCRRTHSPRCAPCRSDHARAPGTAPCADGRYGHRRCDHRFQPHPSSGWQIGWGRTRDESISFPSDATIRRLWLSGVGEGPHRRVIDAAPFAELGRRILDDEVRVIYNSHRSRHRRSIS
jgi:hypothetical protein